MKPRFEFELELELAAVLVPVELEELVLLSRREEVEAGLPVSWLVVAVMLAVVWAVSDGELLPSGVEDSDGPFVVVASAAGGAPVEDGALPCVMLVARVKTPSLAVWRL